VVRAATFGASGARDLIMQGVRARLGALTTFEAMGMAGCDHSIVDHCVISWSIDEGFTYRSAKNITLQRSLISECLNVAGHPITRRARPWLRRAHQRRRRIISSQQRNRVGLHHFHRNAHDDFGQLGDVVRGENRATRLVQQVPSAGLPPQSRS
jgi:hypothetical protein